MIKFIFLGEVKDSITRLFCQGRKLLENFSSLIGKMKIRTVLEDELEIILELCSDLLTFHEILFSIDLKSCLFVWKLYGKLVKEHCDRLRYVSSSSTRICFFLNILKLLFMFNALICPWCKKKVLLM